MFGEEEKESEMEVDLQKEQGFEGERIESHTIRQPDQNDFPSLIHITHSVLV